MRLRYRRQTPITDLIIDATRCTPQTVQASRGGDGTSQFRIITMLSMTHNIGIDVIGFERTAPDPAVDQARDGVVSGNPFTTYFARQSGIPQR